MTFEEFWDKYTNNEIPDFNKYDGFSDETAAHLAWNFQQQEIDKFLKEGFSMSAKIEWQRRLIEQYELIVPKEKQEEIKNWIFSEDDR